MPTLEASGNFLSDGSGLEQTLATLTLNRTYILIVDIFDTSFQDITIRVYTTVLSAGTSRVAYLARYSAGTVGHYIPIKITTPLPSDISAVFTIQDHTLSGATSYPWKVLSIP